MNRFLVAALAVLISTGAHAQTTTTSSVASNAAIAVALPGGAGASAATSNVGSVLNPGLLMGSTGGNSVGVVDACALPESYTAGPLAYTSAVTIKLCWAMRTGEYVKSNPPGSIGYELACTKDSTTGNMFLDFDRRSGINACADNRAKLPKTTVVAAPPAIPANCRTVPGTTALTCD